MEFYKIEFADGRFWFREDDGQEAVELTQEQLGLLLDRLSVMYHAGQFAAYTAQICDDVLY